MKRIRIIRRSFTIHPAGHATADQSRAQYNTRIYLMREEVEAIQGFSGACRHATGRFGAVTGGWNQ